MGPLWGEAAHTLAPSKHREAPKSVPQLSPQMCSAQRCACPDPCTRQPTVALFCRELALIIFVLVYSGCYNKMPEVGSIETTLISFSQYWRLELQALGASMVGWGPLPGSGPAPSHTGEGPGKLSGAPFIRAQIPFLRALSSGPKHHPKASPPNSTISGG